MRLIKVLRYNFLYDIYVGKDFIFNSIIRGKENYYKVKILYVFKIIIFLDSKIDKIVEKIIF